MTILFLCDNATRTRNKNKMTSRRRHDFGEQEQQQPKQQSTLLQKQMFIENNSAFDIEFLMVTSKTN